MLEITPATPWDELPEWLTVEQYRIYLQYKSRRAVEVHIARHKIPPEYVRGSGRGRRIHKDTLRPGADGDGREASAGRGGTVLAIPIRR